MTHLLRDYDKENGRDGFSLIELLVVISIIALLASAIFVAIGKSRGMARDSKRENEITTLAQALMLYEGDKGKFPCQGVRADGSISTSRDFDFLQPLVTQGYIPSIPHDPLNTDYVYEYETFKTKSGGPCGQIAYLGFYAENRITCPSGGWEDSVHNAVPEALTHCHIFIPNPLPNPPCTNPYWSEALPWPSACNNLLDSYTTDDY